MKKLVLFCCFFSACSPQLMSMSYQSSYSRFFLNSGRGFFPRPVFCGGKKLLFNPGNKTLVIKSSKELMEYAQASEKLWNKAINRPLIKVELLGPHLPEIGNGINEIYIGTKKQWGKINKGKRRDSKNKAHILANSLFKWELEGSKALKVESDIMFNPYLFQDIVSFLKFLNQDHREAKNLKRSMGKKPFENYLDEKEKYIIYTMDHEMGHIFGLDHEDDKDNIMYPSNEYSSEDSKISAKQIRSIQCFFDSL